MHRSVPSKQQTRMESSHLLRSILARAVGQPNSRLSSMARSFASLETPVKIEEAQIQAVGANKRGRSKRVANKNERFSPRTVSLLDIPGVGPKYEALLKAKGLSTVGSLHALHQAFKSDPQRMFDFIQEEVGIRNRGHVSLMVNFLSSHPNEGNPLPLSSSSSSPSSSPSSPSSSNGQLGSFGPQPKLTLSVEGNIGVGKSTFLNILQQEGRSQNLSVVPEPVEKWQNVGEGNVNLLLEFYQDPKRLAYTFQNYVFLTRVVQERDSYSQSMTRLLERSVFSDRMIFVRAVHKSKCLSDTELAIYDSWFSPILSTLPTLVPNGFIYLRAGPETCHRRMTHRGRSEENKVPLDYLSDLHSNHEDWLWSGGDSASTSKQLYIPRTGQAFVNPHPSGLNPALHPPPQGSTKIQILDPAAGSSGGFVIPKVPQELRNSLRILDQSKAHMIPQLHLIPALVLDYDQDVDIDRDMDYRRHIANQVELYTGYVRKFTEARAGAVLNSLTEKDRAFNGYYLQDDKGQILYTSPNWHLLSHAPAHAATARQ